MKIIHSVNLMTKSILAQKALGKTVGLVPTMGALHEGHLSLIREARRDNDIVVVSIFVNPAQFGPKEDLKKYPRPIEKDISLCRKTGADILFNPQPAEMYPEDFRSYITVERLSDLLCGKTRPGHFRGVATVVLKLFNITQPDIAYFGQKDIQQSVIIKRMVADLNIPVKVKVMPIVREEAGLALSSRNIYLSKEEREAALAIPRALSLADILVKNGLRDSGRLISRIRMVIEKEKKIRIDYIAVVKEEGLASVNKISGKCVIALAVWIGKTRLIDNKVIKV